jgi:hypothetical protein
VRLPWRRGLPHGKRVPAPVRLAGRPPRRAPEQQALWWAWTQEDRLLAMPRWKRFVLMHVVPVALAMGWQLGVVIGFLVIVLLGRTLLRALWP